LRHNSVDGFAFRHYVFVEMRHNVGSAVDCGRGLEPGQVCDSVTTKAADLMLVYDARVGFLVGFDKKALEVCYKVKCEWVLFILVFKV